MANTTYRIAPSRDGAQYSIYPAGNAPITITGSGALAAQSASMAGSGTVTGGGGGSYFDFPLPAGNAFPTENLTMEVEHPLPDAQTQSNEKHRLHPSDTPIFWKMFIKGGVPPFHYTISSDMPGATIGADLPRDWQENGTQLHGIMTAPGQSVGTYETTLTAEDQLGTIVSTTFTTQITSREDVTKFHWYAKATGNNAADGSWSTPFQDDMRLSLGATSSTSTIQGQIWFKEAGVYEPIGQTDLSANNIRLNRATRPVVFCALRDSSFVRVAAELNYDSARFNSISGGNAAGLYFDVQFTGGVGSFTNFQYLFLADGQDRMTFMDIDLQPVEGTNTNDNSCMVFFTNGATGSDSSYNHHMCFWQVKENGRVIVTSQNSYGITSSYGVKGMVFEDCECVNSASVDDFYLKDSCQEVTLRYCRTDNAMAIGGQNQNGGSTGNIEYVYSLIGDSAGSTVLNVAHEGMGSTMGEVFVTRCTLIGRISTGGAGTQVTNGPYNIYNTVVQTSLSPAVNINGPTVNNTGDELQGNNTYTDAAGKLTETYAAYRGTHGWEIFDS